MKLKNIRIELAPNGAFSQIWIDGVRVENCYKLMLDVQLDRPPRITLGIIGTNNVITGQAQVVEVVTPRDNARTPDDDSPPEEG